MERPAGEAVVLILLLAFASLVLVGEDVLTGFSVALGNGSLDVALASDSNPSSGLTISSNESGNDTANNTNSLSSTSAPASPAVAEVDSSPGKAKGQRKVSLDHKVRDAKGKATRGRVEFIRNETPPIALDLEGAQVAVDEGIYTVKFTLTESPVQEIVLQNVSVSDTSSSMVRVDDAPETDGFKQVFALDPSLVNFTIGTFTAIAEGTQLFKCKQWNFDAQRCDGSWVFLQKITPGEVYTVTLTPDDPGFGEGSPDNGTPDDGAFGAFSPDNFSTVVNTFTATQADDASYFAVRRNNAVAEAFGLNAYMNLSYNLTPLLTNQSVTAAEMRNWTFALNYCFNDDIVGAFACSGGSPITGTIQNPLPIALFNFTAGAFQIVSNFTANTTSVLEFNKTLQVNSGFSDFLSATSMLIVRYTVNVSILVAGSDAAFGADFAPLTVTYISNTDVTAPNITDIRLNTGPTRVGDTICVLANVSDAQGSIHNVTGYVKVPNGTILKVPLADNRSCNSVPGDGEFSGALRLDVELLHFLTSVSAMDNVSNFVNVTSTFNVSPLILPHLSDGAFVPQLVRYNDSVSGDIKLINTSNNVTLTQRAPPGITEFYVNWTFNLSNGIMRNVNVTLVQGISGANVSLISVFMDWENASVFQRVCTFNATTRISSQFCRFGVFARDMPDVNLLKLRFVVNNSDSVNAIQQVDQVFLGMDYLNTTPAANISLSVSSLKVSPNATLNLTLLNVTASNTTEVDLLFFGYSTSSFPRNITANATGGFTTVWNRTQSEGAELGLYRVQSIDYAKRFFNFTTVAVLAPYTFNGSLLNSTGGLLSNAVLSIESALDGRVLASDANAGNFTAFSLFGESSNARFDVPGTPIMNITLSGLFNAEAQLGNVTVKHLAKDNFARRYALKVDLLGTNQTRITARANSTRSTVDLLVCDGFDLITDHCSTYRKVVSIANNSVYTLFVNLSDESRSFAVAESVRAASILRDNAEVYNVTETIVNEAGDLLNATYKMEGDGIVKFTQLRNWNTSGSPDLNISARSKENSLKSAVGNGSFLNRAWFVAPSRNTFDNITINFTASGTKLWKCANFTQAAGCLDGVWVNILNTTPGQTYTITIAGGDPGFGDSSPDEGTPDFGSYDNVTPDNYSSAVNDFTSTQADDAAYFAVRRSNLQAGQTFDLNAYLNLTYNLTSLFNGGVFANKTQNWTFLLNYCFNDDISGVFTCGGSTLPGGIENPLPILLFNFTSGSYQVITNFTGNNASSAEDNVTFTVTRGFKDFLSSTNLVMIRYTVNVTITQSANDAAFGADFAPLIVRYDITPPNITTQFCAPNPANLSQGVRCNSTVLDNAILDTVTANVTLPNGSVRFQLITNITNQYNFTFATTVIPGLYNVTWGANDSLGNFANASMNFTVNDVVPPFFIFTRAIPSLRAPNSTINISANVSDDYLVDVVRANVTLPNGSIQFLRLANLSNTNVYWGIFGHTASGGIYNVTIHANDTSGNLNRSVNFEFRISDLVSRMIEPTADVNRFPLENFTLICNATTTVTDANFSILVPEYDNGTGYKQIPTTATEFMQANESAFTCGNLTNGTSCQHSWSITTRTLAPDLPFRCLAQSIVYNASSVQRFADIISINLTLDTGSYVSGSSSVATLRTNIPSAPYNVTWFNTTFHPLSGCAFNGTTPSTPDTVFFETCSVPLGTGNQPNATAVFSINVDPSRNVTRLYNVSISLNPREYLVSGLAFGESSTFLQHVQAIRASVVDNDSSPAINECCSIAVSDPNSGAPVYSGPVKTIGGQGFCRDDVVLDFQKFMAPQDYVVTVDAWQCADPSIPSSQRKRGSAQGSFAILEHVTNNGASAKLKTNATTFAGLSTLVILHNRTNNFGVPMDVLWTAHFANNVTEADFSFTQFEDVVRSVNVNTTNVEYDLPIPPSLDTGSYRIEMKVEYLVDDIVREIDLYNSESFIIMGVNDTVQVHGISVRNSDGNRTNETALPPLGAVGIPRVFLTSGMPYEVCLNFSNLYTGTVEFDTRQGVFVDLLFGNSFFPESLTDTFLFSPGNRTVRCAKNLLPSELKGSDSWILRATGKMSVAEEVDILQRNSNFFAIKSLNDTFQSPRFYIAPNSSIAGLPGVFMKNEVDEILQVFDNVQPKGQDQIPWGSSEICHPSYNLTKNFTCDYTTYLSAGESFHVCFAFKNLLDSKRTLFLDRLVLQNEELGTTAEFGDQIPVGGDQVGVSMDVRSTYDAGSVSELFGANRTGITVACSKDFILPAELSGSNAWKAEGVLSLASNRQATWSFESEEFAINGRLKGGDLINITAITFEPRAYVPGESMMVRVNFTSVTAESIDSTPLILEAHDRTHTVVAQGQEYNVEVRPGNNSRLLTFTVPINILDFNTTPYHLGAIIKLGGESFEKMSNSVSGLTFNATELLSVAAVTDKGNYYTTETLQLCANISNRHETAVIPFNIKYAWSCAPTNTDPVRSLLGLHIEPRTAPANVTRLVCHDFEIPNKEWLLNKTTPCTALLEVTTTGDFEGKTFFSRVAAFNVTDPILKLTNISFPSTPAYVSGQGVRACTPLIINHLYNYQGRDDKRYIVEECFEDTDEDLLNSCVEHIFEPDIGDNLTFTNTLDIPFFKRNAHVEVTSNVYERNEDGTRGLKIGSFVFDDIDDLNVTADLSAQCKATSLTEEQRQTIALEAQAGIVHEFNDNISRRQLTGWDLDNERFSASFEVTAPAGTYSFDMSLPQTLATDAFRSIKLVNATLNGVSFNSNLRVTERGVYVLRVQNAPLNTSVKLLNFTIATRGSLPHNISSTLDVLTVNSTSPINITYDITLASGDGFFNGQKRGVVFIYEFISYNGTGTLVDQDDFDAMVTPLILETTVTVGTPTTITASLQPKLGVGLYAIEERIRLKEKEDIIFSP